MALIEFKDYPDTSTPLNAKNLNYNFNELLNLIFPVGKVTIFFDSEDHSNYLGFQWERTFVGRMPVGYNPNDDDFNSVGKTGGSKTHTQTAEEVANHTHQIWASDENSGTSFGLPQSEMIWDGIMNTWANSQFYINRENWETAPMNILNPYEVAAYWKRVS